jgi:hypothetical protein
MMANEAKALKMANDFGDLMAAIKLFKEEVEGLVRDFDRDIATMTTEIPDLQGRLMKTIRNLPLFVVVCYDYADSPTSIVFDTEPSCW